MTFKELSERIFNAKWALAPEARENFVVTLNPDEFENVLGSMSSEEKNYVRYEPYTDSMEIQCLGVKVRCK